MLENILLVVAGTLTALIAGLFFSFSVAVNGGLHRLKDIEYLRAFQSINRVILNPVFLLTFSGPIIFLPIVTFLSWGDSRFIFLIIASILYVIFTFGVTMQGNVPLNNLLDRFAIERASASELSTLRTHFEKPWNKLHAIRTIASIIATILLFVACLY